MRAKTLNAFVLLTVFLVATVYVGSIACRRSSSTEGAGGATSSADSSANPNATSNANPNATIATVKPVDIEVGRGVKADNHVADASLRFSRKEPFFFALVTEGTTSGAKIRAFATCQATGEILNTTKIVDLKGRTATSFQVSPPPSGWPVGWCQVRLLINDESYGTRDFEVR